jgi:hypothetical protein
MPKYTSYASLANSGKQSKRIAYFKLMGSTATATATTTSSPCGRSYNLIGPCNCDTPVTLYQQPIPPPELSMCCINSSGNVVPCPSCASVECAVRY